MKVRTGPAGIQIFNRISGLNVLLDEVTVPRATWASAPRFVSIALTNSCDLRCPYCFAPKHSAALKSERVIGWLSELETHGCLGVGFGGGEPTLHRDLVELCRYGAQNTGMAVTLTTHAHRLDRTLLRSLAGLVHFFRVSMDGVGRTYEELRGRSFHAFSEHLAQLRTVAPFGINYVVNAQTMLDLDAASHFATKAGASEFLLLPERPTRSRKGIDNETIEALRKWVTSYRGPVPLSVSEAGSDGLPTCNPLSCEGGLRAYAFISADGILKTSSFESEGVAIGDGKLMEAQVALRALSPKKKT